MLACGDKKFAEITKKTRKKVDVKARQNKDIRFSGVYGDKCDNGLEIPNAHISKGSSRYLSTPTTYNYGEHEGNSPGSHIRDPTSAWYKESLLR